MITFDGIDIVVHVPHASTNITLEGFTREELFSIGAAGIEKELLQITDRYTDILFTGFPRQTVEFAYSRILVDVERFVDDAQEPMAEVGRGVIYTNTSEGKKLREPVDEKLRHALLRLYHKHHEQLGSAVNQALKKLNRCLIIDGHSYPDIPLVIDQDKTPNRPDICIGTDPFHTPDELTTFLKNEFLKLGLTVWIDRPYRGAIVPIEHYGKNPEVHSIMVEVNRKLYMDETTGEKRSGFNKFHIALRCALLNTIYFWRLRSGG